MAEKTSTGKLISAVGGILLIISLFLPWLGVHVSGALDSAIQAAANQYGVSTSFSGWDVMNVGDLFMFVTGIVAIVPAALDIFDLELELPFEAGLVILVLGAISALWVILRMLDKHGLSWKFGIFVALIGAAVVAFGGFSQRGEEEVEYAAALPPQGAPPQPPPAQQPPAPPAPPQQQPPQQQPPQPPPAV